MANKNHYKKIFVGVAALFVLFAPVGSVLKTNLALAQQTIQTQTPTINTTIPTQSLQTFSVTPTTVPAAGTTAASTGGTTAATTPTTGAVVSGAGAGQAQTQNPSFLACATNAVTCSVYYVALFMNGVMGLLVSIGAFLVRLGLQFNDNIYNSPAVQTGFSVALAIANLGFVLGIIIIAIATIIRNQTYGMKQLLWKLVFMAILVNFGLVITAPIVGFASSMSNYFINATSPGSMSVAGYEGYAQTMTAAFAPQDLQLGGTQNTNTAAAATGAQAGGAAGCEAVGVGPGLSSLCGKIASFVATVAVSDNFWQMCMAMIFDVVFSAMIVFTFFCLAILLIIRYLMLAGLLIVLPLAWLTYVFPKFDNSFSKWWNTFIKWTFFPPLALFFIYLAFITATNSTSTTGTTGTTGNAYEIAAAGLPAAPTNSSNGTVELSLGYQTGLSGVVQQAADEVLLVGLVIMGLMFALSLSGKAGKATVGAVAGGSKALGTWVGKSGRRAAYGTAARVAQPKPRVDPITGNLYSPITGPRANAARWLRGQANRKDLQTPGNGVLGKTAGLAGSVWGGAKKGSGLFKDKNGAKDWACQSCGYISRSTKKPTISCPQCHNIAAIANWTVVG